MMHKMLERHHKTVCNRTFVKWHKKSHTPTSRLIDRPETFNIAATDAMLISV